MICIKEAMNVYINRKSDIHSVPRIAQLWEDNCILTTTTVLYYQPTVVDVEDAIFMVIFHKEKLSFNKNYFIGTWSILG